MKKKFFLVLFSLFLFTIFLYSDNKAKTAITQPKEKKVVLSLNRKDLKSFCDKLVKLFFEEKFDAGFSEVSKYWPIDDNSIANVKNQINSQLPMIKEKFGEAVGYVFFEEKEVSDIFVRFTYIVKYENHILRWVIVFYKPKEGWIINYIKWDDNVDSFF